MRDIKIKIRLAALLAVLCTLGLGPSVFAQSKTSSGPLWLEDTSSGQGQNDIRRSTFSELAEGISPAVVNVIVEYSGSGVEGFFEGGDWSESRIGQGSGFIIHPSGLFLTNNHVVEGAETIKVRLLDNRELDAEVVGIDEQTDIALMKIRADATFPAVPLGDSDGVHVGEHVLAIGNPLGLSHTVTSGIVSALGRRNLSPSGRDVFGDFIQTDASINPGNSGGPLISLGGKVIGINTAINRQGQGIGFAIPINIVKTLVPQLHDRGYVIRTWLGIRIQEVTPELAKSFGLKNPGGALVTEVVPKSPASKAGLRAGDIVLNFNEKAIQKSHELPWLASTSKTTEDVVLGVFRNGTEEEVKVRMEEVPDQSRPSRKPSDQSSQTTDDEREFGVAVSALGSRLARQLGASSTDGVVVTEIADNSPAQGSGLRRRDVIVEVGDKPVKSIGDYTKLVDTLDSGQVVRLKVVRGGRVVFIAFER